MRLINTTTLRLKEFSSSKLVRYAILSHRWGPDGDEVTFEDIEKEDRSQVELKPGWEKVVKTCEKAREWGFEWAWIDTCCINKNSSAELTEAINSMFSWYRDSAVCFAILNDVKSGEDVRIKDSSFRKSVWFTRGWTLQELIAPTEVVFYIQAEGGWQQIGNKASLRHVIMEITQIEEDVLLHCNLLTPSIAKKMSWAANRQTTKVEDRAYSLAGIFGVTISPIYGEGENAFRRLQIEISKASSDQSLFAWVFIPGPYLYDGGMFAPSPDCFRYSSDIVKVDFKEFKDEFCFSEQVQDHTVTNEGLRIRLPFVVDGTIKAIIEQLLRPYKYAKEISTMKRTMKLMRENLPMVQQLTEMSKRSTIRAFLACRFASGDKKFISIALQAKSSGRYSRYCTAQSIDDLRYDPPSALMFYGTKVETLYISDGGNPLLLVLNHNVPADADHIPLSPGEDHDQEHDQTSSKAADTPKTPDLPVSDEAVVAAVTDKLAQLDTGEGPKVSSVSVDPDAGTMHLEVKLPESGRKLLSGLRSKGWVK